MRLFSPRILALLVILFGAAAYVQQRNSGGVETFSLLGYRPFGVNMKVSVSPLKLRAGEELTVSWNGSGLPSEAQVALYLVNLKGESNMLSLKLPVSGVFHWKVSPDSTCGAGQELCGNFMHPGIFRVRARALSRMHSLSVSGLPGSSIKVLGDAESLPFEVQRAL